MFARWREEVMTMANQQSVSRVCPFCEATCGVTIEVADGAIVKVRGDRDDPFSRGFICPKAYAPTKRD